MVNMHKGYLDQWAQFEAIGPELGQGAEIWAEAVPGPANPAAADVPDLVQGALGELPSEAGVSVQEFPPEA